MSRSIASSACRFATSRKIEATAGARPHADANDDQIGLERAAAFQCHALAVDGAHRVLEMEDDAVFAMEGAHEVAYLGAEDAFHRPFLRRDHMDVDAARAQGGGNLQA